MSDAREALIGLRAEVGKAIVGNDAAVTGLIVALLCRGHVLIEGVPGVAKTTLVKAFATCPIPLSQVTDDVQLIELAGGEVWLVPGEERNLKITLPTDLQIAEMLLA